MWKLLFGVQRACRSRGLTTRMAKSKYEYVRKFEIEDKCLPETWMVVRLDGRCFHKFSEDHKFNKPNDESALKLMNRCAESVIREFSDIVLGYGQSDEYSFVFKRSTNIFKRRPSKIITTVVSHFASCYVFHWSTLFPTTHLQYPPSFDARVVTFPNLKCIRDYLSWRQVDCHINNLYNTSFWALVQSGETLEESEKKLRGTVKKEKNELLFSKFDINYNSLSQMFRKGTVLIWAQSKTVTDSIPSETDSTPSGSTETDSTPSGSTETDSTSSGMPTTESSQANRSKTISTLHEDIIGEAFWTNHPSILF